MEKILKIPLSKRKVIFGTLAYKGSKPRKLVILVHGLCGNEHWPPLLQASRYFKDKGYATYSLNLYSWQKGARRFRDTSLSVHAQDLNAVISFFKARYRSIFIIGHSFGGLTILRAQPVGISGVSLWDPSSLIEFPPDVYCGYNRKLKRYYIDAGYDIYVSDKYRQDLEDFPNELELIGSLVVPVQIAYAAGPRGILKRSSKRYYDNASSPKELVAVPRASHCFVEDGTEKVLFDKTAKWFKRIDKGAV